MIKAHGASEARLPTWHTRARLAHALPAGRVCCLMGASGAGKTTLMDVLAFRKTAGKVEGTLRLNGEQATADMLSRIAVSSSIRSSRRGLRHLHRR